MEALGQGEAATYSQFARLVSVPRGVVALIPPLFSAVGGGEAVVREGVDAQAAIVLQGPGPKVPRQAEEAEEGGAVFALLPEEGVR